MGSDERPRHARRAQWCHRQVGRPSPLSPPFPRDAEPITPHEAQVTRRVAFHSAFRSGLSRKCEGRIQIPLQPLRRVVQGSPEEGRWRPPLAGVAERTLLARVVVSRRSSRRSPTDGVTQARKKVKPDRPHPANSLRETNGGCWHADLRPIARKRAGADPVSTPGPRAGHTQVLFRRPASPRACSRSLVSMAQFANQGLMQHHGYALYLGFAQPHTQHACRRPRLR